MIIKHKKTFKTFEESENYLDWLNNRPTVNLIDSYEEDEDKFVIEYEVEKND